jgi:phosphoadenosine phosphosulfate reductase
MTARLTIDDSWNDEYVDRDPRDLLARVYARYGSDVTLASSFGAEDVVLIDMACQVVKTPDVFCLDTGLLFPETYQLIDRIQARYALRFRSIAPRQTVAQQANEFGEALWARNPNQCCALRKVEPLLRALDGRPAWITGIRRDQAPSRQHAALIEWDPAHDLIKVNPLAYWTDVMVWDYIRSHHLEYNPLHDQNYPSIGCLPCTRPVQPGESARAGRWAGFEKTECGLHQA